MKTTLRFHHLKIELQDNNGNIEMIPYRDIRYMIYEKPYTILVYMEKEERKKIICELSLVHLEKNLPPVFFRCSPNSILNLGHLRKYSHSEKQILMDDGKEFSLSRRRYCEFKSKLALLPQSSFLCKPCQVCTNTCPERDGNVRY
jgi:DNA-binding LytR/AlgR family response regulator